jgi:predicted transcriptional regulator
MPITAWPFFLEFAMTLLNERKLTLTELAKRQNINVSTCWRWAQRGVRGSRLETFSIGGRRWTTEEAFARFVEATTAAANGDETASRTNRQVETAIRRAEASLKKHGI